ncbi:TerC family protein [Pelistega suis]|uniref:TerC family protein n=1 Tax=Pelistega suis TaxID=1631957 RepID=A0A849P8L7_9BURK|nr:TerC family protein [Pelistega suis]NOL51297.1 TerC family protein [Pelistega suis]
MLEWFDTINWGVVASIVIIDILLGGDNAVIIALASRNLEKSKRMQGILWGTFGAIAMRVVLIFFAMELLNIPFVKIVGAVLLLWIGIKLLLPQHDEHGNIEGGTTVWSAVKTILIADFVMSLDNVIAIAGAAQQTDHAHQMGYVIFGLLVSVPIIIWGSTLVLKLIDRFPLVIVAGAALLGWIAGHMLVTDIIVLKQLYVGADMPILDAEGVQQGTQWVASGLSDLGKSILGDIPVETAQWRVDKAASAIGAIFVVGVGLLLAKRMKAKAAAE